MNDLEKIDRKVKLSQYEGEYKIISTEELIERLKNEPAPIIHHLPVPMLDRLMNGVEDGEVIMIGGLPGHGKSQLCTFITRKLDPSTVLYFTYEVTPRGLMARFNYQPPLFYIPSKHKGNDLNWLEERIDEALAKYPTIKHVFIDCLQDLYEAGRMKYGNAAMEISTIASRLKNIAVYNEIILWIPSHVKKPDRETIKTEPQMGDVPDSGGIEHACDFSIYIQRVPNTYTIGLRRQDMELNENDNRALIKIVKARRENAKIGKFLCELVDGEYRAVDDFHQEQKGQVNKPLIEEPPETFKTLWTP